MKNKMVRHWFANGKWRRKGTYKWRWYNPSTKAYRDRNKTEVVVL